MLGLYLGLGGPMIELVESWYPLVDVRCRKCVLFLKFLICGFYYMLFYLSLWVNFVCVECWLHSYMIFIPMEFGHKFQRTFHLVGGENEVAIMQHYRQSWWAQESKSLENHLLLFYHSIIIEWKTDSLTSYLHWLGIRIDI